MPRKCTVCSHPDHEAIDEAIVRGETYRTLSNRFDVSTQALQRHRSHVSTAIATAHEAGEVAEADRLLGIVHDLLKAAMETIAQAETEGDLRIKLAAIRESRDTAKVLLEVAGKLSTQPTINIIQSPEWIEFQSLILVAVHPYPDARQAIVAALREADAATVG